MKYHSSHEFKYEGLRLYFLVLFCAFIFVNVEYEADN